MITFLTIHLFNLPKLNLHSKLTLLICIKFDPQIALLIDSLNIALNLMIEYV